MNRIMVIAIFLAAGCNPSSENVDTSKTAKDTTSIDSTSLNNVFTGLAGCYVSTIKKDTANLKLNLNKEDVSGNLVYKRFETDGNVGTIKGKVKDSLIIADYTFQSEGVTSVREVVFKIQGEKLIEGYGDITMKGDTARFRNVSALKFQEGQPFVKEACK